MFDLVNVKKANVWERDEVLGIIEKLQPTLLPHYHAGLWGSVLTKGSSTKDFDLIIISHDSDVRNNYDEIAEKLTAFGFTDRERFDRKNPFYNECRHIEKWKYDGRRVDVFNLSDEVKIPAIAPVCGIAAWLPASAPAPVFYGQSLSQRILNAQSAIAVPKMMVPVKTQDTDWNKYNGF